MANTPLANPVYLSDSPRFLQRQRLRAARAEVSEHIPSWTCACQKCKLAAQTRAVPGYGIDVPAITEPAWEAWNPKGGSQAPTLQRDFPVLPLGFDGTLSMGGMGRASSSSTPAHHASMASPKNTMHSPKASSVKINAGGASPRERREYFWLLNAVQECCPAADPDNLEKVDERGRRPLGNEREALRELGKKMHAESLIGKFGFKIPDTVILRNGKPRKRYSMDAHGRMQVETLNSSAQLLRILRKYVQMAQKRPALAPVYVHPKKATSPMGESSIGSLKGSHSEPFLPSSGGAGSRAAHFKKMRGAEPLREAAVLYYDDGAVRYMTTAEAMKQMENVSRLPKEFWQHIVMLQTPVPSQANTRYITYAYDAASEGFEPQAPLPLVHRRNNSVNPADFARGEEGAVVAQVPRKININLRAKKGRYGGAGLASGRFEFVLDEADGTLWLINAGKLVVARERAQATGTAVVEDEEIRYFAEEDFREFMEEQEKTYEGLKQRWEVQEVSRYEWLDVDGWHEYEAHVNASISEAVRTRRGHVQVMINGQMHDINLNLMQQKSKTTPPVTRDVRLAVPEGTNDETDEPKFELVSRNAADRLAGVKSPDELLKFYQAESQMLKHYADLKVEDLDQSKAGKTGTSGAIGLCVWFKRWVKVHRSERGGGKRASRQGGNSPGGRGGRSPGGRGGSSPGGRSNSPGQRRPKSH